MFYTLKILSDDQLNAINKLCNSGKYKSGKFSQYVDDPNLKNNLQLDKESPEYKQCVKIIEEAITNSFELREVTSLRRINSPLFSDYTEGMFYRHHLDDIFMDGNVKSDLSCTLFLSDPSTYEGGELSIRLGNSASTAIDYKLEAGSAIVYPSSYYHEVKPVTSGRRRVCAFWIESFITNKVIREVLADLTRAYFSKTDNVEVMKELLQQPIFNLKKEYSTLA